MSADKPLYVPPEGDEPLDAIELALVRVLVGVIVRELREEAAAGARTGVKTKPDETGTARNF